MKYVAIASAALAALVACATASDTENGSEPGPEQTRDEDGGVRVEEPAPDAEAADALPSDAAPGRERALACGDAGYCETRLPMSQLGTPPSLRAVWSAGPNNVWSVSAEGSVLHYDGTAWTESHRAHYELRTVWATASEVWVGGEGGLLLHRNANGQWGRLETGHTDTIVSIYGTSGNDVWFTSRAGFIDHFDGSSVTTFPLGVPGLQLTTVFGRAGVGTYAAGWVAGARPPSRVGVVTHVPYLFELAPGNVAIFNAAFSEKAGFVPASGIVTDAPEPNQRVFVLGYVERDFLKAGTTPATDYDAKGALLGADGPANLVDATRLSTGGSFTVSSIYFPPFLSVWGPSWNDLRMPFGFGGLLRWNGVDFKGGSFGMGYDHVPALARSVHGDSSNMWVVGDGFALKGSAL